MSQGYEFWEDYEVLTVETPENIELKLPLAGFGPRLLAQVIDSLISGLAGTLVLVLVLFAMINNIDFTTGEGVMPVLMIAMVASLVIWLAYFIVFEGLWNGQTPGKRATGIRVVKRGGLPLAFRDVLLRNFLRIIDYFPSHGLVGLVCFFATGNQQRVGDLVADTVVIKEFSQRLPFTWVGSTLGSAGAATGLTPQLSYVAGSYLSRSRYLDATVQLEITARIIKALGYDPGQMSIREREDYIASVLQWQAGGGAQ